MGFVIAGIVALIVLAAYHYRLSDGIWRVSFGIGIILPVILLFFRLRLINSTQYQKHAMKKRIPYMLVLKRYWKPILGTSLSWFMYDFVVSIIYEAFKSKSRHLMQYVDLSIWHFWFHHHLDP